MSAKEIPTWLRHKPIVSVDYKEKDAYAWQLFIRLLKCTQLGFNMIPLLKCTQLGF